MMKTMLKPLWLLLMVVVAFGLLSCASDDDDETTTASATCSATADMAFDSFCLVADGTKVEGTNTLDPSVTFDSGADPTVHYAYSTDDVEYDLIFLKSFGSGSSYAALSNFDGFDTVFFMWFKTQPTATTLTLTSDEATPGIWNVIYSPAGSNDIYLADSGIDATSASVTITEAGASVNDPFVGTINSMVLCKMDNSASDPSPADNCATTITISSGSFKIERAE